MKQQVVASLVAGLLVAAVVVHRRPRLERYAEEYDACVKSCLPLKNAAPESVTTKPVVTKLPPPSDNDRAWCKTWMSDPTDTGECFALVYHHCVDDLKDQSRIPANVATYKDSALKQVYAVQRGCEENGVKCFDGPPKDWTSVCVARPELAGKGKCKKVAPDEWRMWVQAQDPVRRKTDCTFPSTYVKAHFRGGKIQGQYTGKHGRG